MSRRPRLELEIERTLRITDISCSALAAQDLGHHVAVRMPDNQPLPDTASVSELSSKPLLLVGLPGNVSDLFRFRNQ